MDFQAIDEAFRPRLLRYLTRLVGRADAEDLTQVVLLRVSEALPDFRAESSLSTWVYRIAHNAAMDHLRRSRDARETGEPAEDVDACAPSAEATTIRTEMDSCIREFVDRLPETYRSVLVMSEVQGMTNAEIAVASGASLENVKIRLHRARRMLREHLACGCNLYRDEHSELACDRIPVEVRRSD